MDFHSELAGVGKSVLQGAFGCVAKRKKALTQRGKNAQEGAAEGSSWPSGLGNGIETWSCLALVIPELCQQE